MTGEGRPQWMGNRVAADRTDRVVTDSLELAQTQPPNALPRCKMALVLSNDRVSEMKNGPLSGLDSWKDSWRPHWSLWSTAPGHGEAGVYVVVCGPTAGSHSDTSGSCRHQKSFGFGGLCCCLRP